MLFSVYNVFSGITIITCKCITNYGYIGQLNTTHNIRKLCNISNIDLTVSQALSQWKILFESKEIPEPELSIQNILAHVLGYHEVYKVTLDLEKKLTPVQKTTLNSLCECRLARMPIQYIIKEWDFRDLRLTMRPPVFIPRSETEELIDLVVKEAPNCKHFLEIGCGSGAISLALLQELPQAKSVAVDQSNFACKLTLENARTHNLLDRLNVIQCKLCDDGSLNGTLPSIQFDFLVSNPPYVPSSQMKNLEPEIKLYEDLRALEAGSDGLRVIKALFILAKKVLKKDGDMFLEVDLTHPTLIKKLLESNLHYGLSFVQYYKDIYKRDRFVHIKKL